MPTTLGGSPADHASTRPRSSTAGRSIPSLDGLRALSIAGVVLFHLGLGDHRLPGYISRFVSPFGSVGVRVFFVISGFLITTLLLRELDASGRLRLGQFYFRRTLRIFPAFYAYLAVVMLLSARGLIPPLGRIWPAWLYVSNLAATHSWYTGHSWSLSVEEQFYLTWPFALALLGRQRAAVAAICICAVMPVVRLGVTALTRDSWVGGTYAHDFIAAGCLLALAPGWVQRVRDWVTERGIVAVGLIAVSLGAEWALYGRLHWPTAVQVGVVPTVEIGAISLGIAWCLSNSSSLVGRLLNARPVRAVGVVSYSVYLWQQLFFSERFLSQTVAGAFAATGVAALASYFLIERPSLKLRGTLERWWAAAQARRLGAIDPGTVPGVAIPGRRSRVPLA